MLKISASFVLIFFSSPPGQSLFTQPFPEISPQLFHPLWRNIPLGPMPCGKGQGRGLSGFS